MDEDIEMVEPNRNKNEERWQILGFKPQKELFCNKYLPYADQLDDESAKFLASIKENLAKAVAMREMNPGIGIYATRLHIYIKLYGLKFSKEDHVKFIKLFMELLTIPFLEPAKINKLCKVLTTLLKKSQWLSPDDLQIEWRPLYELSNIYLNKNISKGDLYRYFPSSKRLQSGRNNNTNNPMNSILLKLAERYGINLSGNNFMDELTSALDDSTTSLEANLQYVISQCAIYFPKSATQEILDEVFPKLQPLDTGKNCNVFEILGIFLGAMVHGQELWLSHFIDIWDTYQNPPWSPDIMMLISCAAVSTIGRIDWEPYIPTIFTRILRSIDLPVSYKGLKSSRNPQMYTGAIASWIVAVLGPKSSGQKYLNKFMSTIESYLHPANSGKWVMYLSEILVSLLRTFFDRLICERYKKHPWKEPVPADHCLTEQCITDFVECIKPVALQAMYSKMSANDISKIFKHLADLRPELIIPETIERVYATMDSLTEPHKMTAALQCLMSVARALVSDKKYTEGRTHIIPIFFAMLPGIDPNDIRKTSVTLQFLTSFALSIPIVDCSKAYQYYPDLTEEERLLCEQTADLEDFALQFLDRIFVLIEASSTESTRLEQSETDHLKSRFDVFSEGLVQASSHAIFGQCSDAIILAAAKKLATFVKTHLLESRVAGPLLGSLVRIFSRVCGAEFLRILVPYLTEQIQRYFEEHDDLPQLDKQRDELLYYLTMLLNIVRGDPVTVIKYVDTLLPITDYVFNFKCKAANRLSCTIISNLLHNLTTLQTMDIKSSPDCFNKPLSECLPIRHWGEKMKPDAKINWYIPDENVRAVCERLLHHHLLPILQALEDHISDTKPMDRDDLLKNLEMVTGLLRCGNLLPNWDTEEPLQLYNSVVDRVHIDVTLGFYHHHIKMPDGSNVRLAIVDVMHRLQEKILATSEDDSKSLRQILMLWEKVALRKHSNTSFDMQLKNYNITKQMQDFRLTKYKRDYRAVVITRVIMQQDCRDELNIPLLTPSHKKIIINMLRLSCSHYSAVRSLAQAKLNNMLSIFPFSYRVIMDELIEYLNVDTNAQHEKFKGALYVLGSNRRARLIVKHDWECIERLWPALLQSKMSEKPSVIKLLDFIRETIHNEFPTLSTKIEISDKAVELALQLVPEGYISEQEITSGKLKLDATSTRNIETYQRLIGNILEIINTNNLHWRYSLLASSMVYNLVHPLTNYPIEVASHFVNNLIHESIQERKSAIRIINYVIRQYKRKQVKIDVDPFSIAGVPKPPGLLKPGNRSDNQWLQYDSAMVPKNQGDWDQPRFMYKTNGYFGWSRTVQMYAPTADQPKLDRTVDEMNEVEKVIFEFFASQANVDKLVEYWSLEEKKGKDKFNRSRFYLIKCLCILFGDMLVPKFMVHLERLIEDKSNESNHRCAAEVLAGLMRGAKHWSFEKTEALYKQISPLIKLALNKITVESDVYWGTCFATAAEHMDPYRQWWLHELLLEEPLKDTTSFIDSSRLYCLQGAYNQHVWRMNSVSYRLLEYLRPYLDHSFQNIRERIGSILINIFEADLQFRDGPEPKSPRVGKIIDELMPKLAVLLSEKPKDVVPAGERMEVEGETSTARVDTEYDVSVRLFKTVCQWLIGVINRCTNGNEIPYFSLLPMACRLEKSESDTELVYICTSLIAMISQALTMPYRIDAVLDKITEISLMSSWSARLAVVDLLQVLVFHNMSIFLSRDEWVDKVQTIVLRLLEDNVLEVREKASEVLCGMLHCSFLTTTDKLLELFKTKCKTKISIKRNRRIATTSSCSLDANMESRETDAVRIRHTGVLGLCAFISAYPYDVPEFVPNVFEHLGAHLNDPQPIPSTIRKTMGDFKRTHHDNWEQHQLKFTEDQLAVLSDLTVPPSYYA